MYCKCYFAALWELSHAKKASWLQAEKCSATCAPSRKVLSRDRQEHEKQAGDGNEIQLIPQVKVSGSSG